MKAVVVEKYGEAILKEVALREIGPEEVKAKIAYCGIGRADPFAIRGEIRFPLLYQIDY